MFARDAIDDEEVAVARGRRDQLARPAIELAVDEHRRLRRVPVVRVVRRGLVVPRHLARIDIQGDERAGEEIVQSLSAGRRRIGGGRVAGAEDVEAGLGIVRARNPRMTATMNRGVQVLPGVEAGVTGFLRRRVPLPLEIARLGIERLQEPWHVEVVARPHEHVVVDDHRCHRVEVLLLEAGEFLAPAFRPVFASSEIR